MSILSEAISLRYSVALPNDDLLAELLLHPSTAHQLPRTSEFDPICFQKHGNHLNLCKLAKHLGGPAKS